MKKHKKQKQQQNKIWIILAKVQINFGRKATLL